ncbi:uncharacterized protein N7473_006789 [Penicillium subrubescens]|uniref:uncharacterized protein n=1 Tax=Penicillium subrubescens TaxID=1316194 RepID=UPI002544E9AF|nr:uncharacterized protein N7473_006789 [Penicillium subrubescens]KAJ5890561.1 hypothetical protein N7473_006789 [Penicillium subrubescens]
MLFSIAFIASVLAACDITTALRTNGDPEHHDNGLKKICPHLKTQDKGCIRYTRGYDVTGVLTTVTPNVNDECACIEECLNAPASCDSYVWKYNDDGTRRYEPIAEGPTQIGGLVPKATTPSGEIDELAVSGPVWQLEGGGALC